MAQDVGIATACFFEGIGKDWQAIEGSGLVWPVAKNLQHLLLTAEAGL
jgi:hypothetical protein